MRLVHTGTPSHMLYQICEQMNFTQEAYMCHVYKDPSQLISKRTISDSSCGKEKEAKKQAKTKKKPIKKKQLSPGGKTPFSGVVLTAIWPPI